MSITVRELRDDELEKVSGGTRAQGVINTTAVVRPQPPYLLSRNRTDQPLWPSRSTALQRNERSPHAGSNGEDHEQDE